MHHDKFQQQLLLLLLLVANRTRSVNEIAERMGVTPRTVYYYLRSFQGPEFGLEKRAAGLYTIRRDAPWVARLCGLVRFTDDELLTLRHLLATAGRDDPASRALLHRVERFYDMGALGDDPVTMREAHKAESLRTAISERRTAVLRQYRSGHTATVRDRLVEPYRLINGNRDLRALEVATRECKTFRLSRMEEVTVYDSPWIYPDLHRDFYNDIFGYASEAPVPVVLRLDTLARDTLCEEHPRAALYLRPEPAKGKTAAGDCGTAGGEERAHYLLEADVSSPKGVGRFVISLYDHIEILRGEGLSDYVNAEIARFAALAAAHAAAAGADTDSPETA